MILSFPMSKVLSLVQVFNVPARRDRETWAAGKYCTCVVNRGFLTDPYKYREGDHENLFRPQCKCPY